MPFPQEGRRESRHPCRQRLHDSGPGQACLRRTSTRQSVSRWKSVCWQRAGPERSPAGTCVTGSLFERECSSVQRFLRQILSSTARTPHPFSVENYASRPSCELSGPRLPALWFVVPRSVSRGLRLALIAQRIHLTTTACHYIAMKREPKEDPEDRSAPTGHRFTLSGRQEFGRTDQGSRVAFRVIPEKQPTLHTNSQRGIRRRTHEY